MMVTGPSNCPSTQHPLEQPLLPAGLGLLRARTRLHPRLPSRARCTQPGLHCRPLHPTPLCSAGQGPVLQGGKQAQRAAEVSLTAWHPERPGSNPSSPCRVLEQALPLQPTVFNRNSSEGTLSHRTPLDSPIRQPALGRSLSYITSDDITSGNPRHHYIRHPVSL